MSSFPMNYLDGLLSADQKAACSALDSLVEDLNIAKEAKSTQFLKHPGSEDFLWSLVRFLGDTSLRVAGNASFVLGTVAECELGCQRVVYLTGGQYEESSAILPSFIRLLSIGTATGSSPTIRAGEEDSGDERSANEVVLNSAGALGTIATISEGRDWLLGHECVKELLARLHDLLTYKDRAVASNCALVLARLSVDEAACRLIARQPNLVHTLTKCLSDDAEELGLNAAFAVGRLCECADTQPTVLWSSSSKDVLPRLVPMLSSVNPCTSKNACFVVYCLAKSPAGLKFILEDSMWCEKVLLGASNLLQSDEAEMVWFGAQALHSVGKQASGCLCLLKIPRIILSIQMTSSKSIDDKDNEEVIWALANLVKPLERPAAPVTTVVFATSVSLLWDEVSLLSSWRVTYRVWSDSTCVYHGPEASYTHCELTPHHTYHYALQIVTEVGESPCSTITSVTTKEDIPGRPVGLYLVTATPTQLKVAWSRPTEYGGPIKAYDVYLGENHISHTTEQTCIISGLSPSSNYSVSVSASTSKGRGEKACMTAKTTDSGMRMPSKPVLTVLGRSEMHATWNAPVEPLGRINRYEVLANGKTVYSGTAQTCTVRNLVANSDYSFVVVAITNEGKAESKPAKKRTSKDEYDVHRVPLYVNPTGQKVSKATLPPVNHSGKTSSVRKARRQSSSGSSSSGSAFMRSSASKTSRRNSVPQSRNIHSSDDSLSSGQAGRDSLSHSLFEDKEKPKSRTHRRTKPISSPNQLTAVKHPRTSRSESMLPIGRESAPTKRRFSRTVPDAFPSVSTTADDGGSSPINKAMDGVRRMDLEANIRSFHDDTISNTTRSAHQRIAEIEKSSKALRPLPVRSKRRLGVKSSKTKYAVKSSFSEEPLVTVVL